MIPGGGKLIAGSHSSYAFIESDECVIDSTKFKEYIDKTEDESLSRTRRISMYKRLSPFTTAAILQELSEKRGYSR